MSETLPTTTPSTESISREKAEQIADDLLKLDDEIMPYLLVERATKLPDGTPEINAIHAMRLAIMTFAYYSKYPSPHIDPYQAAVDAMVHDFPEGRANDVATLTASPETLRQKEVAERQALQELQELIGPVWPQLMETLNEYEEQLLPRTRAVRLKDKIDPSYTHVKNYGEALRDLHIHSEHTMQEHDMRLSERFSQHRQENPDLALILDVMRRKVARAAFNGWEQLMIQFDE